MAGILRKAFWISFAGAAALCAIANQALAAKGDWPMLNFDAQGTRNNRDEIVLNKQTVKSLQLVWQEDISGQTSSPAVVGGIVYVGGNDHFYALDAISGTVLWSVTLDQASWSSPAVAKGVVYIANGAGILDAFDAATGKALWSSQVNARAPGSPTVSGGHVFIQDGFGQTYAFNARTGKLQWEATVQPDMIGNCAPVVANDTVISQSSTQGVHAYDMRTGTQSWVNQNLGSGGGDGPLTTDGHQVYVFGNSIVALNAGSGAKIWSTGIGATTPGGFALEKSRLYMFDANHSDPDFWVFDAKSGQVQAKAPNPITDFDGTPTYANGVLYGSNGSAVSAWNPKTGEQLWTAPLSSAATTSPVVSNGMVYVVGGDGSLYAYGLKN